MRNYEERAKDFIAEVYPYIHNIICDREAVFDAIDEFNNSHNRKVIVKHGIARIALITSDYVVKFDYDSWEVDGVGGGESEVKFYKLAEQEGYAYLFAKVTRYRHEGVTFYIMPRVRGIRSGHGYAQNYMTNNERYWCESHRLSDLHSYNYGFRNGKVCIVDYACNENVVDSEDYSSNCSSDTESYQVSES